MAQRSQSSVETTKTEAAKSFDALLALIATKKVKLIKLLERQEAPELTTRLQLESPSISSPSRPEPSTSRAQSFLETMRSAAAMIEKTINEQVENIFRYASLAETAEEPMDVKTENVIHSELRNIQQLYAKRVTLDPNTAHASLIISEDRKQVKDGGSKKALRNSSSRFDPLHYVLGNEGFSSGKFYFEVSVTGQTAWEVGVARESINRKDPELSLSPENGCWTLGLYWGRYQANATPPVTLSLSPKLQKIGVFVDYEGELVSFYSVDTRALIYSFTKCVFTPGPNTSVPCQPSLDRWVSTGTLLKTRIYPIFRPSSVETDTAPLQIF